MAGTGSPIRKQSTLYCRVLAVEELSTEFALAAVTAATAADVGATSRRSYCAGDRWEISVMERRLLVP